MEPHFISRDVYDKVWARVAPIPALKLGNRETRLILRLTRIGERVSCQLHNYAGAKVPGNPFLGFSLSMDRIAFFVYIFV